MSSKPPDSSLWENDDRATRDAFERAQTQLRATRITVEKLQTELTQVHEQHFELTAELETLRDARREIEREVHSRLGIEATSPPLERRVPALRPPLTSPQWPVLDSFSDATAALLALPLLATTWSEHVEFASEQVHQLMILIEETRVELNSATGDLARIVATKVPPSVTHRTLGVRLGVAFLIGGIGLGVIGAQRVHRESKERTEKWIARWTTPFEE